MDYERMRSIEAELGQPASKEDEVELKQRASARAATFEAKLNESTTSEPMGKVKWFSKDKGYGFITDEDEVDRYFHVSDVIGASLPAISDSVTFEPGESPKGPRALKVRIKQKDSSNLDHRVVCHSCKKKMVPRIITGPPLISGNRWTPVPKRSICPFCGSTYQKFESSDFDKLGIFASIAIAIFILLVAIQKLNN